MSASLRPVDTPCCAITGSSGFVGRHLVQLLVARGWRVRTLSRQPHAAPGTDHRQIPDYQDAAALTAALQSCDVVLHLAARAHVLRETEISPEAAFRRANLDAAVAVARAAQACGVRRVVLVSSIGVNGDHTEGRPFTDTDVPAPHDLYAVTKWEAEQAVATTLAGSATDWTVLRPCLVYADDCPGNFQRLLRMVARLPVVPLGGLRRKRSLIHVDNLCDAMALAAVHSQAAGRTFVLADGVDLSVGEVARLLARGMGRPDSCVWNVPEGWLRALATAAGRAATLDKLAQALEVDISGFRAATGWQAPMSPAEALPRTARGYLDRATA